jgi:hypothetical protein
MPAAASFMVLTPAERDIALEMMVFVAQLMVDHDEALGVMRSHVMLIPPCN